jgi:hypothetical protein
MLNSHPALKVYSELFLPEARGVPMWEPKDIVFANTYLEERMRRPGMLFRPFLTMNYVRYVFDQPDVDAVGFKFMYDQARYSPSVLGYAAIAGIRVVHLVRRDLLDTLISSELARARRLYHVASDNRPVIPWASSELVEQRIRLDPADTLSELTELSRERRRMRRWLRVARIRTHEVVYEDLVRDPQQFGRILDFLSVDSAAELESSLQKLNNTPKSEAVENFDELARSLAGTAFEPFVRL